MYFNSTSLTDAVPVGTTDAVEHINILPIETAGFPPGVTPAEYVIPVVFH